MTRQKGSSNRIIAQANESNNAMNSAKSLAKWRRQAGSCIKERDRINNSEGPVSSGMAQMQSLDKLMVYCPDNHMHASVRSSAKFDITA